MNGLIGLLNTFRKFDWSGLSQGSVQRSERLERQEKAILAENQRWFERENNRPGAAVQGAAPDEVRDAIAKIHRERADIRRRYFGGVRTRITRVAHDAQVR